MQKDFHYYATYCAAVLAGYTPFESETIAYCAALPDFCSKTFLSSIGAPLEGATMQTNLELMDAHTDLVGLQDITRIWASFHFLPYDLYAKKKGCTKRYLDKYRLLCKPNGALVKDTVLLAKDRGLEAAGLVMHIVADTWAHRYFAGTPSLVLNNTTGHFFELLPDGNGGYQKQRVVFTHSPSKGDDIAHCSYKATLNRWSETSIMMLGHGRAGHLPDYSFARYRYLPAWAEYEEIEKDNPSDYEHAFLQMLVALEYLRGTRDSFELDRYDAAAFAPWAEQIRAILNRRQTMEDSCMDWSALGERISGRAPTPFARETHQASYRNAAQTEKDETVLGRFLLAALRQKSMVTNKVFSSGNLLMGISVDYMKEGLRGIRAYHKLIRIGEERDAK